ncbi:uncharacterized protein LOC141904886 [Tubulanus polymorphus]|uniref:uncharacterized protein LOC141904886 n=1 Tax=Tubulanus polymorphus TaxID=672921 RepID=UPI003DA503B8
MEDNDWRLVEENPTKPRKRRKISVNYSGKTSADQLNNDDEKTENDDCFGSEIEFNFHALSKKKLIDVRIDEMFEKEEKEKELEEEYSVDEASQEKLLRCLRMASSPPSKTPSQPDVELRDPHLLTLLDRIKPTDRLENHFQLTTSTSVDNNDVFLSCNYCERIFPSEDTFLLHLQCHITFTPWMCPLCPFAVNLKSQLASHMNNHSKLKHFKCDLCGSVFFHKNAIQNHMKDHFSEHICSICDQAFHDESELIDHNNTVHTTSLKQGCKKLVRCLKKEKTSKRKQIQKDEKDHIYADLKQDSQTDNNNRLKDLNKQALKQQNISISGHHKKPQAYDLILDDYCHIKTESGHLLFSCKKCQLEFKKRNQFLSHLTSEHKECKPYKCLHCDYSTRVKPNVFSHMKIHNEEKKHVCSICHKGFHFSYKLEIHMQYHANERNFTCDICGSNFNNAVDVNRHKKRLHTEGYPFTCDVCGKGFKYKLAYTRHSETHVPGKTQTCPYCNKWYRTKHSLRIHMQCHTTIFQCQICDKNITSYSAFVQHKNSHDPNYKGFPCEQCGKKWPSQHALDKHTAIAHMTEKPFECEFCGKSFKLMEYLKAHMVTHSTEKECTCHICGAKLKRKSSLIVHLKRHKMQKPFVCGLCGKEYSHRQALSNHLLHHSQDKVKACTHCEQTFTSQTELEEHVQTEHVSEPEIITQHIIDSNCFLCEQCNEIFENQEALALHILTDHMKEHLEVETEHKTELVMNENGDLLPITTADNNQTVFIDDMSSHGNVVATTIEIISDVDGNILSIPTIEGSVDSKPALVAPPRRQSPRHVKIIT